MPYERVEYLPFGEVWIEEVDSATGYIPFRFTSKELDRETGLYYYGARYYEPKFSRWMSADPAGFALVNPMGSDGKPKGSYSVIEAVNWYSYTSNNPVIYVDPTGMETTYTLTIYNIDPTSGKNIIAAFDSKGRLKVGHTWVSMKENDNPHAETVHRGWSSAGNANSGGTVAGEVLKTEERNRAKRTVTEKSGIQITEEQYDLIMEFWDGLPGVGEDETSYNLGGREADPGALNCTQAVLEALESAGVDTSALRGSDQWGDLYPKNIPKEYQDMADMFSELTTDNPNSIGIMINNINNANKIKNAQ